MNLNKDRFTQLIRGFQLRELFNELGWDNVKRKEQIINDEDKFELDAIGEKRNFVIFICSPDKKGKIPNQNIRRKIDNKISKLYFEHLIIYVDENKTEQIWQLVMREVNKPIIPREFVYYSTQYPEILLQKLSGLFFSIDDEENISLPDVKARVQEQFNNNAEKVTKKFYERFQKELGSFQKFIEGVEDKVDKKWYASLMLNRLMFIYFIQKKGFLDNNVNYLYDKLKLTQKAKGKNKFYSFYKDFLLVLFHDGLGSPKRTKKLEEDLGKIPYLNGGLFEVHQLEEKNKKITIDDKAFEKIFNFFDEYNWHLDNRPTSSGRDINPDVIGYIFEKYINDRAAMGAYYTKEDITEYISKNTILPFLFDEVKKECANAFRDESSLWKLLRENSDRYIYSAVKHGIYVENGIVRELPEEIKKGINPRVAQQVVKDVENNPPKLLELRKDWNKPAPEEYALPTEIWREVVERRNRYFDIKSKIESGEIKEINDFITYNLDIRQFAQDAVEQYEGSDFINAFYKAITKISILDPTCGSGAFLFAALNILEPLYETCISRMRGFIEEDDKIKGKKYPAFRDVVEEIKHHPNEKYFIYKSIILKNLFGVDIMKEATEIAKLRLFLKLVAEVEVDYKKDNLGLEPLPDIDFNIRSGNTLVGFAKAEDVDKSVEGSFDATFLKDDIKKIKEEAELVSMAFERYKDAQLIIDKNNEQHGEAKEELKSRLKSLNDKLNIYQARIYGIDPKKKKEYEDWKNSHQPFHWFAEFYEIMNSGGFDVIIGNPPYVEYSKVRKDYSIIDFETENCGNLYAFILEVATKILTPSGKISVIIPLASFSTGRMKSLQRLFASKGSNLYLSNYEATSNPTTLFIGVKIQLSIIIWSKEISLKNQNLDAFSTKYIRCFASERPFLFKTINYSPACFISEYPTRISEKHEQEILNKMFKDKKSLSYSFGTSSKLYYRNMGNFFFKLAFPKEPVYYKDDEKVSSTTVSALSALSNDLKYGLISVINSTSFYYLWILFSDCYHLSKNDIGSFPFDLNSIDTNTLGKLNRLSKQYSENIESLAVWQIEEKHDGTRKKYRRYFPQKCKSITDEIDKVLAEHYGFTEEELDFIINYDIKYRMGKESAAADKLEEE